MAGEERLLGDGGPRREHELGRRRPVGVRDDQRRRHARRVPDLQRLRHSQSHAGAQGKLLTARSPKDADQKVLYFDCVWLGVCVDSAHFRK